MPSKDEEDDVDDEWLEGEQWSSDQPEIVIDLGPGERKKEPWEELGEYDLESQLILQVVLAGREPPLKEYSQLSCSDFIGTIPRVGLKNLPPDFRPQKTLEQLYQSEGKILSWCARQDTEKPSRRYFMV